MEGRIGILGGSFDPIHMGHINIARSALTEYRLDEVWFVPAGHSPNKAEADMTPAEDRANMVGLAIAGYRDFRLSRVEIGRQEVSYTYLTLTRLVERHPGTRFYFIMGADSLDYFEQWRHPEIIAEKAVILVAVRDQMDLAQIRKKIEELRSLFQADIRPLMGGKTDISSTALREQVAGGVFSDQLPEPVAEYIKVHGLYRRVWQGSERARMEETWNRMKYAND